MNILREHVDKFCQNVGWVWARVDVKDEQELLPHYVMGKQNPADIAAGRMILKFEIEFQAVGRQLQLPDYVPPEGEITDMRVWWDKGQNITFCEISGQFYAD